MTHNENRVTLETANHVIEVSEGCLSIGEHTFPDHCVTLTQEETQEVLKLLLAALPAQK